MMNFNYATASVTRFGEILPLWQKFTSIWQIFDSLFLIRQNAENTLANLWHYSANFHCCKWPNIENDLTIWSHWPQQKILFVRAAAFAGGKLNSLPPKQIRDPKRDFSKFTADLREKKLQQNQEPLFQLT